MCAAGQERDPFIVVGGLAVVAHGYGRQTQDLYLVVSLEPDGVVDAFAAGTLGYRPIVPLAVSEFANAEHRARLIADKGMTVLSFHSDEHPPTPIDIFATEPFDFDADYAAAMVEEIAPNVPVRIVRLATLLRMKRDAGRPQDLAELASDEENE